MNAVIKLPQTEFNAPATMSLTEFVTDFGDDLLNAVSRQNPPIYEGQPDPYREAIMAMLSRQPFPAQRGVVQAISRLLIDEGEKSAIINAEMGTGKTMMAIAAAAVMHAEGYRRSLVIAPPHLVYKWRREILETISGARVWVLNGPDTIRKLLQLRTMLDQTLSHSGPEFFILGRVRMRMGLHWQPAFAVRKQYQRRNEEEGNKASPSFMATLEYASCPCCGEVVKDSDGEPVTPLHFKYERQQYCQACDEPLWNYIRPGRKQKNRQELVIEAMCQLPTIGRKTAEKLVKAFGENLLSGMLEDNLYEFINLMDENGELVFTDRQAKRMERAMAGLEISFGQGGYQPTEFIKRYLPDNYFDLLIVDEGHEYKNDGSAQGQAMGVLANKVRKVLLLTGTLMGGYADDLFFLLWRILPQRMIEDGYHYNLKSGSLGTAAMAFIRRHGVLKDIYKEVNEKNHRTARGKRISVRTQKAPGFGPLGIARYVLPYTVFLKLKDIGGNVLPPYQEYFKEVAMSAVQAERYEKLAATLTGHLKEALRSGDTSLLGVVLNCLLAWPETCFREEVVKHPRTRKLLAFVPAVIKDKPSPKESALIRLCKKEKDRGRRVLVYTTYTGTRDTTARLKGLLEKEGLKTAVLRASVETSRREDWICDQVERGMDVIVCNPELVKTGLDLLDFPTIVFMQTGYNVYTLQQAARRSWRIGQKVPVDVYFLGYAGTAQMECLSLMAKKITVSQSTSGDMPETGLEVLNQESDSIEIALAKKLAA
ncbi:MAG: DEAD/DEAH box helicase family protein [Gammaproteobacteria bacterium]|nr:DEAD/DEAH box helicase family protein [Gammaproteobacteria bacterium]MDH5652999.1 DEAD/DEAH box helicase family protein [Gammaproteobacteria bacterium]